MQAAQVKMLKGELKSLDAAKSNPDHSFWEKLVAKGKEHKRVSGPIRKHTRTRTLHQVADKGSCPAGAEVAAELVARVDAEARRPLQYLAPKPFADCMARV